jgi:hypothetical protein
MEYTEWFPGHIKPYRKGVYQQKCGFGKELGYQRWDGESWSHWVRSPEQAANSFCCLDTQDPWRGIKKEKK